MGETELCLGHRQFDRDTQILHWGTIDLEKIFFCQQNDSEVGSAGFPGVWAGRWEVSGQIEDFTKSQAEFQEGKTHV